jgi:hypothetical protein
MVRVRGVVNFFTPTSILPRQWEGRILRNSFNFTPSLPLRERIKVRGAVKVILFHSSSSSSLSLRERIKVRGAVKSLFFVLLTASPILEKIKNPPRKGEDLNKTEKLNSSLHYHHLPHSIELTSAHPVEVNTT